MTDERSKWLQSLKEGDEVVINESFCDPKIKKVVRVTATQILVDCGWGAPVRFDREGGSQKGDCRSRMVLSNDIEKATAKITRSANIYKVQSAKLSKLSDSQLSRIVTIIEEPSNV